MFTSNSTARCECFVWGRPLPRHSDLSAQVEGMATARPWYYGAPDLPEGREAFRQRTTALPLHAGDARGEGELGSRPIPAPAAWDLPGPRSGSNGAFTLIELMVASALGLLTAAAVLSLSWYSGRSFAAVANYVDLDQASQLALDKMSREIRQAHRVTDYSATSLSLLDVDNNPLNFNYDPDARTLVRVSGGQTNILLTGCDFLQFTNYQHTVISNTFDAYAPAYVTNSRLIQVTWVCSRKILGAKVNTESVQSAKIALRNN